MVTPRLKTIGVRPEVWMALRQLAARLGLTMADTVAGLVTGEIKVKKEAK